MRSFVRGQVSFEFVAISAIAILILTTSSFFMFQYSTESAEAATLNQLGQAGLHIVDEAKNMYVFGEGSFVTISVNLPEGVREGYVTENNTLVFLAASSNGDVSIPIFSDIPINGTRQDGQKMHVNAVDQPMGAGPAEFTVTSKGTFVEIEKTS